MLSSGTSNAAVRRRFQFQRRRCCSTPAMASLSDFPDNFFEEIKSKIIIHDSDKEELESSEENSPTADATTPARATIGVEAVSKALKEAEQVAGTLCDQYSCEGCCEGHFGDVFADDESSDRPGNDVREADDEEFLAGLETGPASWTAHQNAKAVVFSLKNQVGGLVRALRVFKASVICAVYC
ncbi:tryptophan 5-hydroxylase 1-like [Tropilaelaps mercedesae]|uniref:Tryptophan 5-hydroxylase 1-like n=1 Tax=Tropilaelaps mercedesae TaxID=418985 RepID=A0A1V9X615_9ACAR|nr:tryptophan 5-hydroxylase 1-like [Tropilaelaps mercedesae]